MIQVRREATKGRTTTYPADHRPRAKTRNLESGAPRHIASHTRITQGTVSSVRRRLGLWDVCLSRLQGVSAQAQGLDTDLELLHCVSVIVQPLDVIPLYCRVNDLAHKGGRECIGVFWEQPEFRVCVAPVNGCELEVGKRTAKFTAGARNGRRKVWRARDRTVLERGRTRGLR